MYRPCLGRLSHFFRLGFFCLFCQLELSTKEQEQKKRLIENAFGDWNRKDFRAFVAATERHGR